MRAILIAVLACGCVGGGDDDPVHPQLYLCDVSGYRCIPGGCVDLIKRNQPVCGPSPEWNLCESEGLSDCRAECERTDETCE